MPDREGKGKGGGAVGPATLEQRGKGGGSAAGGLGLPDRMLGVSIAGREVLDPRTGNGGGEGVGFGGGWMDDGAPSLGIWGTESGAGGVGAGRVEPPGIPGRAAFGGPVMKLAGPAMRFAMGPAMLVGLSSAACGSGVVVVIGTVIGESIEARAVC